MTDRVERYSVPVPMLYGAGAAAGLADVLAGLGVGRPLVVTDAGVRDAGVLDRAIESLPSEASTHGVFDAISSNPREEDVREGVERFRSWGADGIVAVGGGSALDAAKGVRLLVRHPGKVDDYDLLRGGLERIVEPLPPLVAVPTTAGTGSEVSRGALIITRRGRATRKTIVASPRLVPSAAILDPALTVSLPPHLTAATGLDALCHAIEEVLSPRHHPVVEALALAAARRVARWLPVACRQPENLEARGELLIGAMMAGIGFEKGLGVVHSLSHAVGARHDLHHGLLNAVIEPFAIEFNRGHRPEATFDTLAAAIGAGAPGSDDAVTRLARGLRELAGGLGIPARLREVGDLAGDRDEILALALEDHCHRTNPRPCGPEDLRELWDEAW